MNRGRLIAGLTGGLLGLITIPVLGPFAALVTLSSGFAIRNILENLDANKADKDSDRATDESTPKIDWSRLPNRHETIPPLSVPPGQPDYNSLMNDIHAVTPQIPSYLDNLLFNSTINSRATKRKPPKNRNRRSRKKIRIDEYGQIYDPKD